MNHVEIAVQKDTVPTCTELFLGFLTLGLIGFGGVLPLARKVIVEQRHWLSPKNSLSYLVCANFYRAAILLIYRLRLAWSFAVSVEQ